jgi:rare lipoprotein A
MRNAWDISVQFVKLPKLVRGCFSALAVVSLSFAMVGGFAPTGAVAKTPGKTYCFSRVCHRVLTLAQTRARVGKKATVLASYYDDCRRDRFNPCGLTSSGTVFRPGAADNAASPIYPNGTKLLVFNPRNGRAAVVRIDNAGPYWGRRTLDLSRAAADKLGIRGSGVARLTVKVVKAPTAAEARYRRKRRYAPVKGFLGKFGGIREAAAAAGYAAGVRKAIVETASLGADPNWARSAAKATPVLPVLLAAAPAPLPVKPGPTFKREIRKLATDARQRRLAIARKRREAARRLAVAKAQAAEKAKAAERRQLAAVARKKMPVVQRKGATAKAVAAKPQVAASKPATASGQQAPAQRNAAAAQQPASAPAAAASPPARQPARTRTVWRREILGTAQNAS